MAAQCKTAENEIRAMAKDGSCWPDVETHIPHYPGGLYANTVLSMGSHLISYHLDFLKEAAPVVLLRVTDSREAVCLYHSLLHGVITSNLRLCCQILSVRNKLLQEKLFKFLIAQEERKRSGSRDLVFMAHHPNNLSEL